METRIRNYLCSLVLFSITLQLGWAQSAEEKLVDSEGAAASQSNVEPDTPPQRDDSHPSSSLDQSLLAPFQSITRGYISSGIHVSQGVDTNPNNSFTNSSQLTSVTNVLGSVNLLRLGRNSQTAIDYLAGATFYSGSHPGNYDNQQTQVVGFDHRVFWRKTQLTIRDSLQNFRLGGYDALGSRSAYALRFAPSASATPVSPAASDFLGVSPTESQSSLFNLTTVDLTRALSRRSSVFLVGAYSFTDYLGTQQALIGDHQFSAQAGYNYQLNRRDEIGFVYGYRSFRFPQIGASEIITHSVQFSYRRRISGRMTLSLGGGPEFANLRDVSAEPVHETNTAAHAGVVYQLERTNLSLSYNRLVTAGSGVFAGANSDIVRFSAERALFRSWQTIINGGFSRDKGLAQNSPDSNKTPVNSYKYMFVGAAVRHNLGQRLDIFASYEFSNQNLGSSICDGSTPECSIGARQRHVAEIGFDWRIPPAKLQ